MAKILKENNGQVRTGQLLVDSYLIRPQMVEASSDGTITFSGEFARCGVPTQNKRIYNESLWTREITRLNKAMQENRLYGECDHPCLIDNNFIVLTETGWKKFEDIKVGEKVWSRVDGKAVLSDVTGVVNQPYDGPAYKFSGQNFDSGFTPAHKFLLRTRSDIKYSRDVYVTTQEILDNRAKYAHHSIPKGAEWELSGPSEVVIPKFTENRHHSHKRDVSHDLVLDSKLFAAFMGIYLSEGHCKSEEDESYFVGISQKTKWSKQFIWDEILSKFPKELEWNVTKTGFSITDARLYRYLKPLGDAYEKYVPLEVKNLGREELKEFVYWFNIGDGRIADTSTKPLEEDEDGWRNTADSYKAHVAVMVRESENHYMPYARRDVFSVSKRLVDDLHECVTKLGWAGLRSVVYPDKDYEFAGHIIKAENKVPLYQLRISNTKGIGIRDLQVEQVHHKGNIYCLTTTHGNFYMEQNGRSFWTGNSDGKTMLSRASHLITNLHIKDGVVIGEARALSTPSGMILKALIKEGCAIGVSSRGYGSVVEDDNGNMVVQEDYRLLTFDVVAEPADATAFPKPRFEGKEHEMSKKQTLATEDAKEAPEVKTEPEVTIEDRIAKAVLEAREQAKKDLEEQLTLKLAEQLTKLQAEAREAVKREFLADPEVALSKDVLDQIKNAIRPFVLPEDVETVLTSKDAEIETLKKEVAERDILIKKFEEEHEVAGNTVKMLGYQLWLERSLANEPDAEILKNLVGDVTQYDSADQIKAKLESVKSLLDEKRRIEEADSKKRSAEMAKYEAQIRERDEALQKMQEAIERSTEINKELATGLYLERRLANHPKAKDVRNLAESMTIRSKDEIDALLEQFRAPIMQTEDIESVRSRVRKLNRSGYTALPIEEEKRAAVPEDEAPYRELGVSLNELKHIAKLSVS